MPKAAGAAGGTKIAKGAGGKRVVTYIAPSGRSYPAHILSAGTGTTLNLRVRGRYPAGSREFTNVPKATTMAGIAGGSYLDFR